MRNPEVAVLVFRTILRKQILSKKVLAQNEIYRNKHYNESLFLSLWKENPRTLSLRKGPKCLICTEPPSKESEEEDMENDQVQGKNEGQTVANSVEELTDPFIDEE